MDNNAPIASRRSFVATGAAALAAATLSFGSISLPAAERAAKPLSPGDTFPDFSLATFDGSKVKFSHETEGHLVLVKFWAVWCPPCIMDIPKLAALKAAFADRDFMDPVGSRKLGNGFSIFSISLNHTAQHSELWREMHRNKTIEGKAHVETARVDVLEKSFGVTSIPHYILVDSERKVVSPKIGLGQLAELLKKAAV